jgi:branched-chain amino acid transport system substrate-binding protein
MKYKQLTLAAIWGVCLLCKVASAAEIKIGVAAALTGNAAQYGLPIRKGFELAAGEINGNGGINGIPVKLVIEDEQGKKEEAINVKS